MRKALLLAERGRGLTRPNPPVGAIVVRNGTMVGSGFHGKAGKPHAEVIALRSAGEKARGATLYVSLEPCSTWGRTPPCTDEILRSGVSRVVVSTLDPNPKHQGRGLSALKKAGIEVVSGVCEESGREMIKAFSKWIATGKPYLTLKMGMTLDGKIADYRGVSKWITCRESRAAVMRLRRKADAVLVGGRTARIDNPSLQSKGPNRKQLYRIIVDSSGLLPLSASVLNDGNAQNTFIVTTSRCSMRKRGSYEAKGARVLEISGSRGHVSLTRLFQYLGRLGLLHVLCEGGGQLAGSLVNSGLVDEYIFFVAPRILGGKAIPVTAGPGMTLPLSRHLGFIGFEKVGKDIMIRAVPR